MKLRNIDILVVAHIADDRGVFEGNPRVARLATRQVDAAALLEELHPQVGLVEGI